MGLKDQVVVITGAGRGIGREAALTFAAEGAKVAAWDKDIELAREVEAEIAKSGGSAIALVQVDQPISAELIARIAAVEGVVQAKVLGF